MIKLLFDLIMSLFNKSSVQAPIPIPISRKVLEITTSEYLMNRKTYAELPPDQQFSLLKLLRSVNNFMEEFGEYRSVNSGIRTMEDHKRIYAEINEKRKAQGLDPRPIPMSSKHLSCQAVDLEDKDGRLKKFCSANLSLLEKENLWIEAFEDTPTWVHFQCVPPASGNRIFKP